MGYLIHRSTRPFFLLMEPDAFAFCRPDLDGAAQQLARPRNVRLPGKVVERLRPEAIRERGV